MSDQSPSDDFETGQEYISPPFEEDLDHFDTTYNEFIHNDTPVPTTEPNMPSHDFALYLEIPDSNQLSQRVMETTPVASQASALAVPDDGIQPARMTCDPAQISTPNPSDITLGQLLGVFDLPHGNLLDTSLTNSQLVAALNTSIGIQPIGIKDQSEIEPPMVRSQPLPVPTSASPYSLSSDMVNSLTSITPSYLASHLASGPSSYSTGPETPPMDTQAQKNLALPQVSSWMQQSIPPILPCLPQVTSPYVTLHLYDTLHWFYHYQPQAFTALYWYTQALINSIYSCQPIPQSKTVPSMTINPVVLGKRVRRDSPSDEEASEESSAEETTLLEPQSDEQNPAKKRKTSTTTTTTTMKKAVPTSPTVRRVPTAPTKHRNSFILYRCLLSNIKKYIQEQDPGVGNNSIPPKKQPAEHQCVFSKRAGIVYKTPCRGAIEGLQWCNCSNCLMRRLFERAAAQLKDDVHLVETQLRKSPNPLQAEFVPNRQRIDQAMNWAVFEKIYYQSDLFRKHVELYIGSQLLTVEQIRAIWMENEVEEQRKKFDAVKREFL
ncbi:hypothetical protein BGZ93_007507 [Podila epicladia]|nr:hypothetical protein BGZ93_007507 [Podila epicladia]